MRPTQPTVQSAAGEDLANVVFRIARHHRQHFVARLEHRVAPRHYDMFTAYNRDDRRVARNVEVADRVIDDGRIFGECDFDEANVAAFELQDAHEPADGD